MLHFRKNKKCLHMSGHTFDHGKRYGNTQSHILSRKIAENVLNSTQGMTFPTIRHPNEESIKHRHVVVVIQVVVEGSYCGEKFISESFRRLGYLEGHYETTKICKAPRFVRNFPTNLSVSRCRNQWRFHCSTRF